MYGKVIDVSKWQGNVDFNAVKAAGYKGAIIRVGCRGYGKAGGIELDPYFRSNIEKCKKAKFPFGVYFFSQAINLNEAIEEARFVINNLTYVDAVPDFPVYIDTEYSNGLHTGRADKLTKSVRTGIVAMFCDYMEKHGYYTGIYASTSWLNNQLDMSRLSKYDVWVAHYANKCGYNGSYGMWQFSSTEKIPGVKGNCDCSYCYKNYPHIIQTKCMNGYKKPVTLYDVTINSMSKGDLIEFTTLANKLGLTYEVKEVTNE